MSGDGLLKTVGECLTNTGEDCVNKIALGSRTVDDGHVMTVDNG